VVADDLESSFYVVLWTALLYKETYMDIFHRTQVISDIFETAPGSASKALWLIGRTNLPHYVFVDCKPLDELIHTLGAFFSHRYTVISDEQRSRFEENRRIYEQSIKDMPDKTQVLKALHTFMVDSPVYQKEMGMKDLHSHDAVVRIFNKHLDLSGWPDKDAAVLRKPLQEEKYGPDLLVTKSQSRLGLGVEVTPSGKRRRLDQSVADADDGDALSSITLN
jgi:hypothetical protein